MEEIKTVISNLVSQLKEEISEFYKIYETYLTDLINSKNINTSLNIDSCVEKDATNNILSIIAAINSAFITIGVDKSKLTPDHELFEELYEQHKSDYTNFLSFLQIGLKEYINKHLFSIILEFLMDKDKNKIENLDLFDLLPNNFRNNLIKFKINSNLSERTRNLLSILSNDLTLYFDPSNYAFKGKALQNEDLFETVSEEDVLKELQEARQDNLDTIAQNISQLPSEISLEKRKKTTLMTYFLSFPKLDQVITNKIEIDIKKLRNFILSAPEFLDLENLYYIINIFKMLGKELQIELGYIENIVKNFVSGNIFSTGVYHKPSPISIYFGLSLFSELHLLNTTELIDLLDIEMFLENELTPFIPEKLSLHFYTFLSLKLLEKNGGIIKDKDHLIEPLKKFELFKMENFTPSDLFYYLATLKILDENIDLKNIQVPSLEILEKTILPDGSFNGSTTETAKTLLSLVLLNSTEKELTLISNSLKFLNQNLRFFIDLQEFNDFNSYNNKIAFKVELRMLFWMLVVFSQYF